MGRFTPLIGTRWAIIKIAPVAKGLHGLSHDYVLADLSQQHHCLVHRALFRELKPQEPDERFDLREQTRDINIPRFIKAKCVGRGGGR